MRVVVALGGNALLSRGEPLTAQQQRQNVHLAAEALVPIARQHQLVISHGNGPQVGLLALQGLAYRPEEAYPLDILDAETEGMIGYLIEQELGNLLPGQPCATLLTQIEVMADDAAFGKPSKPIGPVYSEQEAQRLAREKGWVMARDGEYLRRVVPSPRPRRILELGIIEQLVSRDIIVICAGGGGIPVVRRRDGTLVGVEAVIDKDHASALLARELKADALLMLSDVAAVYQGWGAPGARPIRRISSRAIRAWSFAEGSMGPKVEAACEFVEQTGGIAAIGRLQDAAAILAGERGTQITAQQGDTLWWD